MNPSYLSGPQCRRKETPRLSTQYSYKLTEMATNVPSSLGEDMANVLVSRHGSAVLH